MDKMPFSKEFTKCLYQMPFRKEMKSRKGKAHYLYSAFAKLTK